ncbi:terpene synthase family protein [Chitinophaga rhizosphaerae]|uniref:terpene synthase family protein n=1 Tax=Chitinophaga rhizosphaerae TaxID=1864947 RepID=UPI000F800763|nr:hypothetical protein [Chitinophaga rhizosphaerae]
MKEILNANALQYSFTHRLNPNAEAMEALLRTWIETDYNWLPDKMKFKYGKTGMGHCGGCIFPHASMAQLTAVCRFFIWAFTVDDIHERSEPSEIERIRKIAMEALRYGNFISGEDIFASLPQMREELLAIGSPLWLDRFCDSIDMYFDGLKQEVGYRVPKIFPEFKTFVDIRMKAVNVYPMIHLAEAITGTVLPEIVVKHPVIDRIEQLTCRILAWSNDYFSAHLEKDKDVLNLVLMIEHESGCSLSEAYVRALAIHDADVDEFLQLKQQLPEAGMFNEALWQYVENLQLMISGYLHWTLQLTERYKKGGHPSEDLAKLKEAV